MRHSTWIETDASTNAKLCGPDRASKESQEPMDGVRLLLETEHRGRVRIQQAQERRRNRIRQARREAQQESDILKAKLETDLSSRVADMHKEQQCELQCLEQEQVLLLEREATQVAVRRDEVVQWILHLVADVRPCVHRNVVLHRALKAFEERWASSSIA